MNPTGFAANQPLVEVIYFPSDGTPVQKRRIPTKTINSSAAGWLHSRLKHVPDPAFLPGVLGIRTLIFVELPVYTSTYPPTHETWYLCKGMKGHGDIMNPTWSQNPELSMYGDAFLFRWEAERKDQRGRAEYASIPIGFIGSFNVKRLCIAGAKKLHAGELTLRLAAEMAT